MSDPIETICSLVGCSREEAEVSYARTNSVLDSVEELIVFPESAVKLPMKRKRELTPEEEEVTRIRHIMEKAETEIQKSITASNQRDCGAPCVTQTPHEEKAQQNNDYLQCRLPSLVSEVEIPEIVYPLRSGYFCGSPSHDQK
jgi:hypothetical protein